MQIGTRSMCAQLHELNALKTQTDNRPLFCILVALIPNAAFGGEHLRMFRRETIKARTSQPIFPFHKKAERHRQFAKSFLIGFNGRKPRYQIAFAVCSAARVKPAVQNRCRKWANRPFAQVANRLHVVVSIKNITLWPAAAFTVDYWIAIADP